MSQKTSVSLAGLGLPRNDTLDLSTRPNREAALWQIADFAESELGEAGRDRLARNLGERLAVDYEVLVKSRLLSIMSREEIREAAAQGFDLQLHTHRHRLPVVPADFRRELTENQAFLMPLVSRAPEHFCYPSNQWQPAHLPLLEQAAISSAVTCDPGFNDAATSRLLLHRFLDHQHITQWNLKRSSPVLRSCCAASDPKSSQSNVNRQTRKPESQT